MLFKRSECQARNAFSERGLALTGYDDGMARLSMPGENWQPGELEHLQDALRAAG